MFLFPPCVGATGNMCERPCPCVPKKSSDGEPWRLGGLALKRGHVRPACWPCVLAVRAGRAQRSCAVAVHAALRTCSPTLGVACLTASKLASTTSDDLDLSEEQLDLLALRVEVRRDPDPG